MRKKLTLIIVLTLLVIGAVGIAILTENGFKINIFDNKGFNTAKKDGLILSAEEKAWLENNKERTLIMGLDPLSGMEHFEYEGVVCGYAHDLVDAISKDLGVHIDIEAKKSWGEVFDGLGSGTVDILIGANETTERRKTMSFTKPIYKYPYALFSYTDSGIETIGDIDGKTVAFIEGDIVGELMPAMYKNIKYKAVSFLSQEEAMKALAGQKVQAFITSGGEVAYEYVQKYPKIRYVSKINTITSDMTLSTRKSESILAGILDKEIEWLQQRNAIKSMLENSEVKYNRKLMNLSPEERNWLETDGKVTVGITQDYLPIDYYENNQYLGISGAILNEIGRRTGIKFEYVYSDFVTLYKGIEEGKINILNLAKTEERLTKFIYPKPYLLERDTIYGRKDMDDVIDVYGLENKRVAVISGFWHKELLEKNLTNVQIIETATIQESIRLIQSGKADYFIENPSVVRYYIEELDSYDIMQKGTTSNDSYLYYGISKNKPELASIIDKVLPLLNTQELVREGFNQVPRKTFFERNARLILIIVGLIFLLAIVAFVLVWVFRTLVKERTKIMVMEVREEFLYKDALTGLYNRNYLNDKLAPALEAEEKFAIIVCDMNGLKDINDQYGHLIGDKLLKAYADFLIKNAAESTVVRLGGDEFLLILIGQGEHEASAIIEKLLTVSKEEIEAPGGRRIETWGAYGYSIRSDIACTLDDMIKEADARMYQLKRQQKSDR